MPQLQEIIQKLKSKEEVDAVFLTGSYRSGRKVHSDIDLIVIFKENSRRMQSVYTWIDNIFADIFFFDHDILSGIELAKELPSNNLETTLVSWLEKADVQFDKSGRLTDFVSKLAEFKKKIVVPPGIKDLTWRNINYNFVANKRYFDSNDPLYHEALEIRMLYSVQALIVGYLELRNIPWRGEKAAVTFLKEKDPVFYQLFIEYSKKVNLQERFGLYSLMMEKVFPVEYVIWNKTDIIAVPKTGAAASSVELREYWKDLTS